MNNNMDQSGPKAFIAKRVYCCTTAPTLRAELYVLHALGDEQSVVVQPYRNPRPPDVDESPKLKFEIRSFNWKIQETAFD